MANYSPRWIACNFLVTHKTRHLDAEDQSTIRTTRSLANWAKWRKRKKTFLLLSSIQQHKQPKSTEAHLLTLGPWLPMLEQTLLWPGGVLCIEVPLRHPKSLSTAQAPNVAARARPGGPDHEKQLGAASGRRASQHVAGWDKNGRFQRTLRTLWLQLFRHFPCFCHLTFCGLSKTKTQNQNTCSSLLKVLSSTSSFSQQGIFVVQKRVPKISWTWDSPKSRASCITEWQAWFWCNPSLVAINVKKVQKGGDSQALTYSHALALFHEGTYFLRRKLEHKRVL